MDRLADMGLHAGRGTARHILGPDMRGQRDDAGHQLRQPLADGEPEAGAAELAADRSVDLAEALEQHAELFLRNADAGIADGDRQAGAARAVAAVRADADDAGAREFDGI